MSVKGTFLTLLFLMAFTMLGQAESFPEGSEKTHIWDYANALNRDERGLVEDAVKSFESTHHSGLWVVIVSSLEKYDANANEIESYAEWFIKDKLAQMGGDDSSILILVSTGDRKARIELGSEWGRQWDDECEHIMQTKAVPNFRTKHYASGILATARALNNMATDKETTPPILLELGRLGTKVGPYSPFPAEMVLPILAGSIGLFVLGFFAKTDNQTKDVPALKWIGVIAVFITLFGGVILEWKNEIGVFCLLVILAFILLHFSGSSGGGYSSGYSSWDSSSSWDSGSSSSWDSGSSFGGSSGSFDSGGSWGGGGGATGSW
jgi:uncharacterized protein